MARLEDQTTGTRVTGLTASGSATVESARWIGEPGLKVIFRNSDGHLGEPVRLPRRRAFPRTGRDGPTLVLRWRRRSSASRLRGVPHRPRVTLRSLLRAPRFHAASHALSGLAAIRFGESSCFYSRRRAAVARDFRLGTDVPEVPMDVRYTQRTSRPIPERRFSRRLRRSV